VDIVIQIGIIVVIIGVLGASFRPKYRIKNKRELGVKYASPIYSDEKGTKLLVAPKQQLQGKPDYIFQTWFLKKYIPLEIKSGILKEDEPHSGDVYQLAAYFLIIEELYGKRPPYGKLVYANKTFIIKNTYKIRKQLKYILTEMRNMLEGKGSLQAEPSFIKCKHCVCKMTVCEFNKGEY
jgi:CRISPR-associated exonuclease Cas4